MTWGNRVHCALGGLESMNIDADRITLLQAWRRGSRRASIRTIDSMKAANLNGIHVCDEAVEPPVDQG